MCNKFKRLNVKTLQSRINIVIFIDIVLHQCGEFLFWVHLSQWYIYR